MPVSGSLSSLKIESHHIQERWVGSLVLTPLMVDLSKLACFAQAWSAGLSALRVRFVSTRYATKS